MGSSKTSKQFIVDSWKKAALGEHASVASFAKLVIQLIAIGAPSHLIKSSLEAAQDELYHAKVCLTVANNLDSTSPQSFGIMEFGLQEMNIPVDTLEILKGAIVEGCLGEGFGTKYAEIAANRAPDKIGNILKKIADDEKRHENFAWEIVKYLTERDYELTNAARLIFESVIEEIEGSKIIDESAGFGYLSVPELIGIRQKKLSEIKTEVNVFFYELHNRVGPERVIA